MKSLVGQIFKFGIVGAFCFFVDWGLMVLLVEAFSLNHLIACAISFSISTVVNYLLSMRFVFDSKEGAKKSREFVLFVILSIIGLGLNVLCMWITVDILGIFYMLSKVGVTAIVMVYNFVTRKIFIEGKGEDKLREKLQMNTDKKCVISILLLCLVIWTIMMTPLKQWIYDYRAWLIPLVSVVYLFCFGWILYKRQEGWVRQAFFMVFLGGFLARALFVICIPYNFFPHDLGYTKGPDTMEYGFGHDAYIEYLFKYGHLPDFDPRTVWSFYQPPVHYVIACIWMRINTFLGIPWAEAVENIKILTLFYTSLSVFVGYKILSEFKIKQSLKLLLFAILSFQPLFVIFAGGINNDALSWLFMFLIILYTIRWYKERTYRNIVWLALFIGLGMMTKTSVAMLAPAVALVFLMVLIRHKEEWVKYMKQFILFGTICIPLGLSYMIRCFIRWDIPFAYVPKLDVNHPQYVGSRSLWERFGIPSFSQFLSTDVKIDAKTEYNTWAQTLRTGLFGERVGSLNSYMETVGIILAIITVILLIILLILFVKGCLQKKETPLELKWFVIAGFLLLLGSYAKFCFDFPHVCTLNARYVFPIIVFLCVGGGLGYNSIKEKNKMLVLRGLSVFSVLYCLAAFIYYIMFLALYTAA